MKKIIYQLLFAALFFSCNEPNTSKVKMVDPKDITPGPVVHNSLNEEQIDKVKFIHKTFQEVYPISLDETITNFKRDQNPDNEIGIWMYMAKTFEPFALKNTGEENYGKRMEAFKLTLMRSMMSEDESVKAADIRLLSKGEIQEIFKSYTLEAKPLKVEE